MGYILDIGEFNLRNRCLMYGKIGRVGRGNFPLCLSQKRAWTSRFPRLLLFSHLSYTMPSLRRGSVLFGKFPYAIELQPQFCDTISYTCELPIWLLQTQFDAEWDLTLSDSMPHNSSSSHVLTDSSYLLNPLTIMSSIHWVPIVVLCSSWTSWIYGLQPE
jgi:hypothetical protein